MIRRPLFARLEAVNGVYDEIHRALGGHRIDLGAIDPGTGADVFERAFWSVDRLHPSELGHRALARTYAEALVASGLDFERPTLALGGGQVVGWRQDMAWMVREGAPWVGRRARDLGPWAVRMAWEETRHRTVPTRG